jgi:small subunit ribosomal protein S3
MIERTFIKKNYNRMELENYLEKKLDRAGFSHLEIIKTPLVTRIVLHVAKPGLAIGKSGSTIKTLTEIIANKYKIDNPQIEIQEIKKPNLNAKIIVNKMSNMMNRGFSWRSVSFRTIRDIMESGAQGVELVFKGALGGKGARKRKQRIAIGYMKKIGDQAKLVDKAQAASNPKIGAIGIKLSIIHPDVVFPDKIDVRKVVEDLKNVKAEIKEQTEEEKKESEENTKEEKAEVKDETKEKNKSEKIKEEKIETKETEKTKIKEKTDTTKKSEIKKDEVKKPKIEEKEINKKKITEKKINTDEKAKNVKEEIEEKK